MQPAHTLPPQQDRRLLPNEPRVPDLALQEALTRRYLDPALADMESLFLWMRAQLDPIWSQVRPSKLGKPYPAGQCLEISLAMLAHLCLLEGSGLTGARARGHAALVDFVRHGGAVRQVWGDLRGEYFQNACLIGALYVDVANDTVVPTKPPVEILPLHQARFQPIRDFLHFARIAQRYWGALAFPNHVLPLLAPYCPVILVIPGAGVQLHSTARYMTALTLAGGFAPSEAVLDAPPLNAGVFELMASCLSAAGIGVPAGPAAGRAQALKACVDFRAEDRQAQEGPAAEVLSAVRAANQHLSILRAIRS